VNDARMRDFSISPMTRVRTRDVDAAKFVRDIHH
jgi:hypothetical protein